MYVPKTFTEALEESPFCSHRRGEAQLRVLLDQAVGMDLKIGPHMKLRHILEYKYGTEFFNEVVQEIETVAENPRFKLTYF